MEVLSTQKNIAHNALMGKMTLIGSAKVFLDNIDLSFYYRLFAFVRYYNSLFGKPLFVFLLIRLTLSVLGGTVQYRSPFRAGYRNLICSCCC